MNKKNKISKDVYLPFHRPSLDKQEIKAAVKVIESGWLTTGKVCHDFAEQFRNYIGAKYAIPVNSCTAALHLALYAIDLQRGDEVLVPTMTFTATAEVVTYFGAHPIMVDCDPKTLLIDVKKIEEKITPRTKAIIPVHYAGQSCDIAALQKIAKKHNLKIIWDAAHSLPTRYKGKLIGTQGDITCFSFYSTKTLCTGEGGMATTNNAAYAERMRIAGLHGMSKDAWKRYSKGGSWFYEIVMPGYKYNLTDLAAAIGIEQLKKVEVMQKKREKIANQYTKVFSQFPEIELLEQKKYGINAWHLFVIKIHSDKLTINRDQFFIEMQERGVGVSVHFIPLHLHPYWRDTYKLKPADFPAATEAYHKILSIPIFPDMTNSEIKKVISAVESIIVKYRK